MITLQQLKNSLKAVLNATDVKIKNMKDAVMKDIPQSSWEQNNETAKDYIIGRTHYKYFGREVLFAEQEIAHGTDIGTMYSKDELVFRIDGVEYKCEYKKYEYQSIYYWYGNGSLNKFGGLPNTGEPFCFIDGQFIFSDGKSHTVEILYGEEKVRYKKLDSNYLSEEITPLYVERYADGTYSHTFNEVYDHLEKGGMAYFDYGRLYHCVNYGQNEIEFISIDSGYNVYTNTNDLPGVNYIMMTKDNGDRINYIQVVSSDLFRDSVNSLWESINEINENLDNIDTVCDEVIALQNSYIQGV